MFEDSALVTNAKHAAQRGLDLVASRNYGWSRRRGLRRLRRISTEFTAPPTVVHQMGKVGSTSLSRAIRTALPDNAVYQVHHLAPAALAAEEAAYREAFNTRRRIDGHLLNALFVRGELDAGHLPDGTRVVSAVRDPITQRLSAYFQTLPFRMPDLPDRHRNEDPDHLADEVLTDFLQAGHWWHTDQVDRFLNDELRAAWGFDALAYEFDRERGQLIGRGNTHDCLVIRFEDFSDLAPSALAAFLGVPELTIPVRQTADEKFYADVVRAVRGRLRLDSSYLDDAYDSPGVRHFYDEDEIDRAKARWS